MTARARRITHLPLRTNTHDDEQKQPPTPTMPIELPPLPWEKDALQPLISKETIEYHYGKVRGLDA